MSPAPRKHAPLPTEYESSQQLRALLADVQQSIDIAIERYSSLADQCAKLEDQGLIHASPHWREKKYLYLIHPTQPDGSRKREYVGTDPNSVRVALDGIERARQCEQIVKEMIRIGKNLDRAIHCFQDVQQRFKAVAD